MRRDLTSIISISDAKVTLTAKKDKGMEINVLGDTMRLGSPSAVTKVESNPFMQQKLLAMQEEINQLLSQINVAAPRP